MPSRLASQYQQHVGHARRLQEASDGASASDVCLLYDRAWAQAFTAGRHLVLADRHTRNADGLRTQFTYLSSRPGRRSEAEGYVVQARRNEEIAQRHRDAAEKASERAGELEQEAQEAEGRQGDQGGQNGQGDQGGGRDSEQSAQRQQPENLMAGRHEQPGGTPTDPTDEQRQRTALGRPGQMRPPTSDAQRPARGTPVPATAPSDASSEPAGGQGGGA
jgi:hypothetical protein